MEGGITLLLIDDKSTDSGTQYMLDFEGMIRTIHIKTTEVE
jgi:hypothetical protein